MTGVDGKGVSMRLLNERRRLLRRAVPLLLAGIIGGAAVLTPAMGSAAAFLTKAKGDKRYLQNTSVATANVTAPPNTPTTATVNCPPGLQALSGGADSPFFLGTSTSDGIILTESKPVLAGSRAVGWTVEFINGISNTPATVHAVCSP